MLYFFLATHMDLQNTLAYESAVQMEMVAETIAQADSLANDVRCDWDMTARNGTFSKCMGHLWKAGNHNFQNGWTN